MVRTKHTCKNKKPKASSTRISKKRVRTPLSKHWCFTINNSTLEDAFDVSLADYVILGHEVGKEGTHHLQGYCAMKKRFRLSGMKKLMPRAHLEIMQGTSQQASDYCKKDGKFHEYGILPQTGPAANKTKWEKAYEDAKLGKMDDIPKDMLVRYYHAFKRIRQDNPGDPADLEDTCGIWYYGPTGIGKSTRARKDWPNFYDKPLNKWWDGYLGQPNILLDDVDQKHGEWLGHLLKRWTDKFPFSAEMKGTTIYIRPKKIIVTSQYRLEEVFCSDMLEQEALQRRFTVIELNKREWD